METASSARMETASQPSVSRIVLRASTVCVLVVAIVNLGIYGLGRMTDAIFVVSPALGPEDLQVDGMKVVITTVVYFAPGVVLLALAARRSVRWVRIVAVAAAVFAVGSAWGPFHAAHDTATGWVLAPMHVTTGAAFVIAAAWVHRELTALAGAAADRTDPPGS